MEKTSPPWSPSVKLGVSAIIVVIVGALLVRFRNIVGPLLLAIILAYLLHPLAAFISRKTRLSWRATVNLIYIIVIILVVSLLTATGVAAVQQTQSLFRVVENFVTRLPVLAEDLSTQVFQIGTFQIDMQSLLGQYDLQQLLNQVIDFVQPMLGQAGSLIRSIATGTFSTLGWILFILLVSYFILADAGQFPDVLSGLLANVNVPGYQEDISRLGSALGRIWNAFMRGQLILFLVTVSVVYILLTILGVRNALALALVAGTARFVPYIGPAISWIVAALVSFFQAGNYLGIEPLTYALIVVGVVVLLDQIIDNLVTPRMYGQALGVHPAAVLVAAIISANLLGLIGLLLAAPALATLTLFGRYAFRKLFDLEPWPDPEPEPEHREGIRSIGDRILERFRKNTPEEGIEDDQPEPST